MKSFIKWLLRLYYSKFYRIKFDPKYDYQIIEYQSLDLIERHGMYLHSDGWERITDVDTRNLSYVLWYRRKKPY